MLGLQILIDGFAVSALYALGAMGFTLIFGVSGVLNLSHGALMVAAAVAAWALHDSFGVNSFVGAAFGVAVAVVLSLVTYWLIVRPIQQSDRNRFVFHVVLLVLLAAALLGYGFLRSPIEAWWGNLFIVGGVAALLTAVQAWRMSWVPNMIREEEKEIFILTATLLWGIIIQEVVAYLYTNNAKSVIPIIEGVVTIAGVRTPTNELFTSVICWAVIAVLWALVNKTRAGKAVLAASMNPRGVTLLGIELSWIYIAVWAIYGALAGIAGVLLGMFLGVSSYSVGPLTASAFSIVVLGGLGSVTGSLIAAYIVGYLETVTAYLISPAYRFIPSLLLLVVVMYVRPRGLLGRR